MTLPALAVTFDFGQTLCDLDTGMLSRRLAERGLDVPADRLEAAVPEAWSAYDAAIHAGHGGHPWKFLMTRMLSLAGAPPDPARDAVDWLWTEQPSKNLWRRPIAGMIDVVRALWANARALGRRAEALGKRLEILLEVNISGEASKFGVPPEQALDLAGQVVTVSGLEFKGLMGIGPLSGDERETRRSFQLLAKLWEKLPADHRQVLSMGMTGDFEWAIAEGSTMVRIGTALFGARRSER